MRLRRRTQVGMTLIELMVALTIGAILSLAVFAVMTSAEGRKRTLTSVNDINQSGNYASYLVDTLLRSAGNGFVQAADYAYGCELFATGSDGQLLPAARSLPDPFAKVNPGAPGVFRLAPVLILPGQTTPGVSGKPSDVLVIMSGGSGSGDVPAPYPTDPTTVPVPEDALAVTNTLAFEANDLVLVADQQRAAGGNIANCMLEQVASDFDRTDKNANVVLKLGGESYAATIAGASLSDIVGTGAVLNLGNNSLGKPPQFTLLGVGDGNTLFTYDLLSPRGTALHARAMGVFEMHALYGVDLNGDGKIGPDEWVSPSADDYAPSALMAGTVEANGKLQKIKAVRVGLVLRTALLERANRASQPDLNQAPVGNTELTLFAGMTASDGTPLAYTRKLVGDDQRYRYRTLELTVPLRNNLLLP